MLAAVIRSGDQTLVVELPTGDTSLQAKLNSIGISQTGDDIKLSNKDDDPIRVKLFATEPEEAHLLSLLTPDRTLTDANKSMMLLWQAEACPDHIHIFVEIPPKMAVSSFMGYLKGKSSTMLYEQFGELKYKYRNREFWCRGYYVDTVGKNESRIAGYIKNQLKEDEMGEQLRLPSIGPFAGSK